MGTLMLTLVQGSRKVAETIPSEVTYCAEGRNAKTPHYVMHLSPTLEIAWNGGSDKHFVLSPHNIQVNIQQAGISGRMQKVKILIATFCLTPTDLTAILTRDRSTVPGLVVSRIWSIWNFDSRSLRLSSPFNALVRCHLTGLGSLPPAISRVLPGMVIKQDGSKWACRTCLLGHRVSRCDHTGKWIRCSSHSAANLLHIQTVTSFSCLGKVALSASANTVVLSERDGLPMLSVNVERNRFRQRDVSPGTKPDPSLPNSCPTIASRVNSIAAAPMVGSVSVSTLRRNSSSAMIPFRWRIHIP